MKLAHLVGTLVLALTLGTALPAAHAQYPPVVGNGRVTRSELKQCQCTQFSGDGFAPNSTVTVYDRGPNGVERLVGTTTADAKGEFKLKVCFDEKSQEGSHTLIGRGVQSDGQAREVRSTVHVDGSVCFKKGDEVHNPNVIGGNEGEEPRGGGGGNGGGSGRPGTGVGGVGVDLPRTGTGYVVPGLLLGFMLVVTGSGVVHLTRRRRLVTG